jgi:quercetin dioxygenase-like cupin family protein
MRRLFLFSAVMLVALAAIVAAHEATAPASTHVIVKPSDIKWGPPPPVFEKGATFTVISGNPAEPGPYVVRLKMPKGYKINPHWHPTDENVTVLSGSFKIGMGEKFDESTMTDLPTDGFVLLPAEMRHYAMAKSEAIVQVHGMGPFQLTYVNPEDDPSTRGASK